MHQLHLAPTSPRRVFLAVLAAVIAVAGSAASAAARTQPVTAATALLLPTTHYCIPASAMAVELRALPHVRWLGATVQVNGRTVRTIRRSEVGRLVRLTGLPSGTYVVSMTAAARGGRHVTATRRYHSCTTAGVTPTPPVTVTPTPPAPAPAPSHLPGSYTGSGDYSGVSFYVSPNGATVQDVYVSSVYLGCAPGGSLQDHIGVAAIPIAANGSFSSSTTQVGVIHNTAATFTYSFTGQFNATGVTGSFREDVTYDNGTAYTCTSNTQSWTATRGSQGTQTPSPPPPGSYSGSGNYSGVSFYVAPDATRLQDVFVSSVYLGCIPGGSLQDHIGVGEIPIAADGSFTSVTSQTGIVGSASATFTYTFSGHFHGPSSGGAARVSGVFREDVTYANGASYSCSSNDESWSATLDTQGAQTASPPVPGTYSGSGAYAGVGFSASAGGTELDNVSVTSVYLPCMPSGALSNHITLPTVAIAADGSFSSSSTETGVINSTPATFTYTFNGHFHGPSSSGVPRVAGMFREDITYGNGTTYTCTSNDQSWSGVRSGA
ncbi:MAG TPA: hypothetical protein VG295_03410 [Solirubrobacteraceae bacterium]|nr:hypothetical protein [Solirubrobacteraceae bacterium]